MANIWKPCLKFSVHAKTFELVIIEMFGVLEYSYWNLFEKYILFWGVVLTAIYWRKSLEKK